MLDGSDDLRRLVRSPVFSAEDQERAIAAVLERGRASPGSTANFLQADRRATAACSRSADMIKAFPRTCWPASAAR